MSTAPFTPDLLKEALEQFDRGSEQRGRKYAANGFATVQESSATQVRGTCRNDDGRQYRCLIEFDSYGDLYSHCTCPVGELCKHCVAVLVHAAYTAAPAGRRTVNNWRALVAELTGPSDAEAKLAAPPRPVALMFALERNRHGVESITVRPATTGKTGRWVQSRLTWGHLLTRAPDDTHDPAEIDLLTRLGRALQASQNFGYSAYAPDTMLLTMASAEFWELLQRIDEAGIELVAATGRGGPSKVALTDSFMTFLHVQRVADGVSVDVDVQLGTTARWPGSAVIRLGRPRPSGLAAVVDDCLYLGPIPQLTLTESRLMEQGEPLFVPASQLEEFAEALPAVSNIRPVEVDEGAIVPQVITGPKLVLQVDVKDDLASRVSWIVAYTVDGEPREFSIHDDPATDSLRDAAREEEEWLAAHPDLLIVALEGFTTWQRTAADGLMDRARAERRPDLIRRMIDTSSEIRSSKNPVDTVLDAPPLLLRMILHLPPLETAFVCDRALPVISERGVVEVRVTGDANFRLPEREPVITFGATEDDGGGDNGGDEQTDWFGLSITLDVDGTQVPLAPLYKALSHGDEYLILDDGTYFPLDIEALDSLRDLLDEAESMGEFVGDSAPNRSLNATLWEELLSLGVVDEQLAQWQQRLSRIAAARPPQAISPPPALQAELRPYQQEGLEWLAFLWDNELGGILADDMGLGKTVQTLALIARALAEDPDARFLVVAPTSVVSNWAAESAKFLPDARVATLTSTAKRAKAAMADLIGDANIVVTSYALLRIDYDNYAEIDWAAAIFDEGQFLKNHDSKVHQAARRLPAPFKLAITGTPMENRIMELWSLVSITAPGLFRSPKQFKEHFAGPIERGNAPKRLATLRRRIKPIMLRRTKDQVLTDLPPKQEQVVELVLEPAHRKIYDTFLTHERKQLLGLLDDFENNRIQVLRALTRLRQLSLHPGLVDDAHESVKSAKIAFLTEQLPTLIDEGHSVLIFSSFTGFLRKLADALNDAGIVHSYLDGTMTAKSRTKEIETFTSGQTGVFLISLKAGGFGLNLTGADYCFMADPWWNPAAESQAIDRAHRIGQQRPVTVYRMVSAGTIEEKVIELQERKRELFSALIDDGEQFSGAITADDVRALLE